MGTLHQARQIFFKIIVAFAVELHRLQRLEELLVEQNRVHFDSIAFGGRVSVVAVQLAGLNSIFSGRYKGVGDIDVQSALVVTKVAHD